MSENPLKGYYLTRIYKGDDPFTTIMDLVREEAIAMCEKKVPFRRANQRKDLGNPLGAYYDERVASESWLRDGARAVGVDTKEQHPVYFALTKEPEPVDSGRNAISIPAENVDLSRCSFTFDDSMMNYACAEGREDDGLTHPLRGVVLNAVQAAAAITKYGMLGNYDKGQRYIEVQMWDRPAHDPSQPRQQHVPAPPKP